MKISRKEIIYYRKMDKHDWHDQDWWDYMGTRKAEAIGYATQTLGKGAGYSDIIKEAKGYLIA